jgi:hypothetical protein
MQPARASATPWYRVPIVWLAIALPLTAVIAGFTTLWLAIVSDDGLVADDYYRRGQEINRDLTRDRAAAARGLKAMLRWQPPGELRIRFNVEAAALPTQLEVQFLHATRGGLDQKILLTRAPDGSYRTLLPALADGRWHVQLAGDDWRLSGTLSVPGNDFAAFVPAP